jgi:hypothetical protein
MSDTTRSNTFGEGEIGVTEGIRAVRANGSHRDRGAIEGGAWAA